MFGAPHDFVEARSIRRNLSQKKYSLFRSGIRQHYDALSIWGNIWTIDGTWRCQKLSNVRSISVSHIQAVTLSECHAAVRKGCGFCALNLAEALRLACRQRDSPQRIATRVSVEDQQRRPVGRDSVKSRIREPG